MVRILLPGRQSMPTYALLEDGCNNDRPVIRSVGFFPGVGISITQRLCCYRKLRIIRVENISCEIFSC